MTITHYCPISILQKDAPELHTTVLSNTWMGFLYAQCRESYLTLTSLQANLSRAVIRLNAIFKWDIK